MKHLTGHYCYNVYPLLGPISVRNLLKELMKFPRKCRWNLIVMYHLIIKIIKTHILQTFLSSPTSLCAHFFISYSPCNPLQFGLFLYGFFPLKHETKETILRALTTN